MKPHRFIGTQIISRHICHVETNNLNYFDEFESADRSKSRTSDMSSKVTPSQKEMIRKHSEEIGITPSKMVNRMAEFYFALHPYNDAILANREKIMQVLGAIL